MVREKLQGKLNLFTLIMLSSAFVISIRNVPTMAETGLHMIFFGLVAAIGYFIPAALISAELATGWPKEGGIYSWVKEAFGKNWGFWASWLQWTNMLLTVISMLYFVGGSLAYVFSEDLAQNRLFLIGIMLLVVWGSTIISLHGVKANSFVSVICFLGGVALPFLLILVLGCYYVFSGNSINLNLNFTYSNLIPDFRNIATIVLLLSFVRTFTGIEGSANHAGQVANPKKNYPIAIFLVVIFTLLINLLGAATVAIVIPSENISLISGIMSTFEVFFKQLNLTWLLPVVGLLIAAGSIGGVNAWLLGPIKGLLATAEDGDLPPFFKKVNNYGIPPRLMILQGIIISIIGSILLLPKNINISFWLSVALSMMIYATMYIMMMISGIYLRYKKPHVTRIYRIPGPKNIGMWIAGGVGIITLTGILIIAPFPPAELPPDHKNLYFITIITMMIMVYLIPFVIWLLKKPSWSGKVQRSNKRRK